MLLLENALDARLGNRIRDLREEGKFLGLGFATDESPPSQWRVNAPGFQVTVVYLPLVPPTQEWERPLYEDLPPLRREVYVLDIAHCPSKRGEDVMKVLGMQFARIQSWVQDLLVGTGDGGGENEGRQSIHATLDKI